MSAHAPAFGSLIEGFAIGSDSVTVHSHDFEPMADDGRSAGVLELKPGESFSVSYSGQHAKTWTLRAVAPGHAIFDVVGKTQYDFSYGWWSSELIEERYRETVVVCACPGSRNEAR